MLLPTAPRLRFLNSAPPILPPIAPRTSRQLHSYPYSLSFHFALYNKHSQLQGSAWFRHCRDSYEPRSSQGKNRSTMSRKKRWNFVLRFYGINRDANEFRGAFLALINRPMKTSYAQSGRRRAKEKLAATRIQALG